MLSNLNIVDNQLFIHSNNKKNDNNKSFDNDKTCDWSYGLLIQPLRASFLRSWVNEVAVF